ncbi:MAG TPA: hypothetical protein P5328_00940 [Candidatus Paceibacterota bacterium]|nr:hypothetical protein [Candidatus Paceibacterota bacterium]HRZ34556.1 hypothetical protein [Candidatus Paceibacterota bacterium]
MFQRIRQNKEILYSLVLIVVPVAILFLITIFVKIRPISIEPAEIIPETVKPADIFGNVEIEARAAIVKDINAGEILFGKNENLPLALASLTKVLTALTFEVNAAEEIINITYDDLKEEGNSLLYPGERFYKKDLIDFTLITSSNDASAALAANTLSGSTKELSSPREAFVDEMNRLAKLIGMKSSNFSNETGLDKSPTSAGAYGSASDIATLFEYILKNYPEILEATGKSITTIRSVNGIVHQATNTNEIIDKLPNAIASKTGFTDIAGGNLAVVIDPGLNRPIIIVVLGSTEEGRFADVEKLAQKTEEYLKLLSD